MIRSNIFAPFEVKFAQGAEEGSFEGYASVYGNQDSHGDVVAPGAFSETLAEKKAAGRNVPMHVMHAFLGGDGVPVGVWKNISEDDKGLHVKGKISGATTTDAGRLLFERVKDGALPGLSIGFSLRKNGAKYGEKAGEPRRTLKSVNLHEISLVADPSNAQSVIQNVKASADDVTNAAASIAACMRMHDKVMSGYSYGGNAKDQALMMDHLRDAHEALTGSRAPDGLDGWTKSADAKRLAEKLRDEFGLSEEKAREVAEHAFKISPVFINGGMAIDPEAKAALASLSGFSLPKIG